MNIRELLYTVVTVHVSISSKPCLISIDCKFWIKKTIKHLFMKTTCSTKFSLHSLMAEDYVQLSLYEVITVFFCQCELYFLAFRTEEPRDVMTFSGLASDQVWVSSGIPSVNVSSWGCCCFSLFYLFFLTTDSVGKVIPEQAVEAFRVARGWGSHIFRHSAHIWREGCQPYAPAAFYPQDDSCYSFLLEAESTSGP
jgi:hypothetical protein